jgi:hypothetical protein
MQFDLPYLVEDVDRHGNVRLYARKKIAGKFSKQRIRAQPGSPTFLDEYKAALQRLDASKPGAMGVTIKVGTLGWLVGEYEQSFAFLKREQRVRHLILESCLNEPPQPGSSHRFRDCPLNEFVPDHMRLMRDRKKGKPGAANNRVKWLRAMLSWACEERSKWVKTNPAPPVRAADYERKTFHTWTREEFLQFETRHPLGSKPRLAMSILAYTGMRRCDAVRLGPQHVKDGWITFTPQKTKKTLRLLCSTCSRMCSTRVRLARRPIWRRSMASHSRPTGLAGGSAIAVTRPIFTSALPMGSAAPARPSLPRTGRRCPN